MLLYGLLHLAGVKEAAQGLGSRYSGFWVQGCRVLGLRWSEGAFLYAGENRELQFIGCLPYSKGPTTTRSLHTEHSWI